MGQKANEVSLRLSVKGREELLKTMRDMGGEYEKASRKIEAGSRKANTAIKGVDTAAKQARTGLEGLASRGGALGGVMASMGTAGLVAGAGIGALGAALAGAMKISREAIRAFDAIGKSADTLLLSTDAFQALSSAAIDEGVEFAKVEGAIRALDKRHSELVVNQGELYSRLKEINPEMVEMLKNTVDNDARLRIMTKALQEAETATQRSTIAYAAFGEGGADVSRMLIRQADGMDGMIARARELGLVVDEKLIRSAEDLENQFGQAAKVIDLQLKQAFIDLAPVMLDAAKQMAELAVGVADFIGMLRDLGDRSDRQVEDRLADLTQKMLDFGASKEAVDAALATGMPLDTSGMEGFKERFRGVLVEGRPLWASFVKEFNDHTMQMAIRTAQETNKTVDRMRQRTDIETLKAQREALQASLDQTQAMISEARDSGDFDILDVVQLRINAQAVKRELKAVSQEIARRGGDIVVPEAADPKALAELNRLKAEAVRLQKDLGDYTAYLAGETQRYQQMLNAGLITPKQYEAAVKKLTDELSGLNKVTATWTKLISDSMSPTAAVRLQISALNSDFASGTIELKTYTAAMAVLRKELADAKQTELEAAPGFADAETIRKDLEAATFDALTPAEKLVKEQERINGLMRGGVLTAADGTDWLELYAKRLNEAAEATGVLRTSEELLDGVMQGRIKTMDDLGRVFGAMLVDMVKDYLLAQSKMSGGGVLGQILSGKNGGAGAGLASIGSSIMSFFTGAPKVGASHSGGAGHSPPAYRNLSSGILSGERLQVVEDSETILTAGGRMNIASQIAGMAAERHQMAGLVARAMTGEPGSPGTPRVTVNNYAGAEVDVRQQEGPEGPELSIDIKGKMQEMARGGVFDRPFKDRYGLNAVGA